MNTFPRGLRWLCGGLLVATSLTVQASVILGGKEWLQPADFTNLSWTDIAAVCDANTGECTGSLNNISLNGWTWASVQDVGALFAAAGIPDFHDPFDPHIYGESNSLWAPPFLDFHGTNGHDPGLFIVTASSTFQFVVRGITRTTTLDPFLQAYAAGVVHWSHPCCGDVASSTNLYALNAAESFNGAWLYRIHRVPEPGTLTLLGLGLAGLGVIRRRRRT